MKLQGKTAYIAAATSGLGLGVARHFAARGANVAAIAGMTLPAAREFAGRSARPARGAAPSPTGSGPTSSTRIGLESLLTARSSL
jgi:NAD(P)-dependent dehydrogenase (short-subunit alcohol dehydrogenase family)